MKSRFVYALPALILSLIAVGLGVYGLSQEQQADSGNSASTDGNAELAQVQRVEPEPSYFYAIAKETRQAGEVLESDDFIKVASQEELEDLVPFDQVPFGQPLDARIDKGSPLSRAGMKLSNPIQKLLTPGFKAVAVELTNLSSVGGLMQPGDSVDVFATFQEEQDESAVSVRLLSSVPVLAVRGATSMSDDIDEDDQRRNATMVLSVAEPDVPRLTLAQSEARLTFAATTPLGPSDELGTNESEGSSDPEAAPEELVSFIGEIRPNREPKKPAMSAPVAEPAKAPEEDPGREVKVFEGSQSRSVYVR